MSQEVVFGLVIEAEADVVRGCCGGNHEFGECPLAADKSEEDTP